MADSRKPARSGPSKKSGPAGAPRQGQKRRSDDDWRPAGPKRSGGPKAGGAGKGPAKGPGKPAGKPAGKPSGRQGRDDDRRPPRRDEPRSSKPSADKAARRPQDDFDFDIDLDFERDPNAPPAAFPKPARPARSPQGRDQRPPKTDRPERLARPRPESAEPAEAEDGKSVTAGKNPVRELLESAPKRVDAVLVRKGQRDARMCEIVALADENRIKVQFVDDQALRRLYPGSHQGVVAVTAAVQYAELEALIAGVADAPLPVLLALDKVQDPGNLGAMARTAWALGAAGIIVPRHGGAYIGAGAMRASAGALHHLPVARVTNMSQALDACAEAGLNILCADAEGENLDEATIHLPAVLVMGGEEKGVRYGVGKHCQKRLAIPFRRPFDSLNVAQAAAICLARLGRGVDRL